MKKSLYLSLLFLFIISSAANAELTDRELLAQTLTFSKKVKEYGQTIGIDPSGVLSKTTDEIPPKSKIIIYLQKRGTLAINKNIDESLSINISKPESEVPIGDSYLYTEYFSAFLRQVNESATEDMPITIDFARASALRQAEVVLHEDLHMNTMHTWESDNVESIVTPLAYLATLNFFKTNNDEANEKSAAIMINYFRKISLELNDFANSAENIYKSGIHYWVAQENIIQLLDSKTNYSIRFRQSLGGQNIYDVLEALVSMDLIYLRYFDKIVSLYEKINNIAIFITDMKKAPGKTEDLDRYLEMLLQKYSNPAL